MKIVVRVVNPQNTERYKRASRHIVNAAAIPFPSSVVIGVSGNRALRYAKYLSTKADLDPELQYILVNVLDYVSDDGILYLEGDRNVYNETFSDGLALYFNENKEALEAIRSYYSEQHHYKEPADIAVKQVVKPNLNNTGDDLLLE